MDSRIQGEQFSNAPIRPQESNSQQGAKKSPDGFSSSAENTNLGKAQKNTDAWMSSTDSEQNSLQKNNALNMAKTERAQTKTILESLGELFISLFSQLPKETKDSISNNFFSQILQVLGQSNTKQSTENSKNNSASTTASKPASSTAKHSEKQSSSGTNQINSQQNQPISDLQTSTEQAPNQLFSTADNVNQTNPRPVQAGSIQVFNNQRPSSNQIGINQTTIAPNIPRPQVLNNSEEQSLTPQGPPPKGQEDQLVTASTNKPSTDRTVNPFTANTDFKFPPLANKSNEVGQVVYESKPSSVPPKKTIIVIDDFNNPLSGIGAPDELKQLSHGTLVVAAAGEELRKEKAENKIKLQALNVSLDPVENSNDPINRANPYFRQMLTTLDKVESIANQSPKDSVAVNISSGASPSFDYLNKLMKNSLPSGAMPITPEKFQDQKFLSQHREAILDKLKTAYPNFANYANKLTALNKQGINFFIASGNQGNTSFDPIGLLPFVTSVGALNSSGNIAEYTDLSFVQKDNLNTGDYQVKAVAGGYDFDSDGIKDVAAQNAIDSPVFPGTSFASPRETVRDTASGIKKQIQGLFTNVNA